MNIKWPSEKRNKYQDCNSNLKEDLRFFIENYEKEFQTSCLCLINSIVENGIEYTDLKSKLKSIVINFDPDYATENKIDLISTWICVLSIVKSPTLSTWLNIRKIFWHSNNIEYWLEDSILVHVDIHPEDRDSLVELADSVIYSLEENDERIIPENYRTSVENTLLYWRGIPEKLTEIWWGLRGHNPWLYNSDSMVFSILKTLSKEKFIKRLSNLDNPYLVDACFFAIGVDRHYSYWEEVVNLAPLAFFEDGEWNESVIMPLLLVHACKGIQQAVYDLPRVNLSPEEEEQAKNEIDELTSSIVELLAQRKDSQPLFARWSTWLMREIVISNDVNQDSVTSVAFINNSLLKAIGQSFQSVSCFQISSKTVPVWERWMYRAVLAIHSYNDFILTQGCDEFIDEWDLGFDDWTDRKGIQLIESSKLFNMRTREIPQQSHHFLAYSIAMSDSPHSKWMRLWNNTRLLREIVEFGDVEDSRIERYKGSTEAVRLILLALSIGIAMLDQLAQRYVDEGNIQKDEILSLYCSLLKAVTEMKEINYFIDIEKWEDVLLGLIIRRLHWESGVGSISIFNSQDKPSFSDLVEESTCDVVFFWRVIENALIYREQLSNKIDLPKDKIIALVNDIKLVKNSNDNKFKINLNEIEEFCKLY